MPKVFEFEIEHVFSEWSAHDRAQDGSFTEADCYCSDGA